MRAADWADQALDERRFRNLLEDAGARHALCAARRLREGVERALRHADDGRDQCGRAEGRIAEARLTIARHVEPRHLAGKDRAHRQYAMLRYKERLGDRDGLGAGPLQAAHVPTVMIDGDAAGGHQAPGKRRRTVFAGDHRGEDQPS